MSVCFPPQLPETVTCVLSGLRGAPSGQWPVWPGRELFGLLWKYLYLELLGRGTLNFLQILIHYYCCVRGQNFHNFYSTLIMYFSALFCCCLHLIVQRKKQCENFNKNFLFVKKWGPMSMMFPNMNIDI